MIRFDVSRHLKERPAVQMTSMIDIMFINLLFFMALFVYFHFETELNISVPKAASSMESIAVPEEITINITREGTVFVNRKPMALAGLASLLRQTAALYPAQHVLIRADRKTFHGHVVQVLDVCAKAKIWNISFATTKEGG